MEVSQQHTATMVIETYYVAFIYRGANFSTEETPENQERHARHLSYLFGLQRAGKIVAFGPIADATSELRGLTIYRTDTADEAEQLVAGDPNVQTGHHRVTLRPWAVTEGQLPAPMID